MSATNSDGSGSSLLRHDIDWANHRDIFGEEEFELEDFIVPDNVEEEEIYDGGTRIINGKRAVLMQISPRDIRTQVNELTLYLLPTLVNAASS